MEVLNDNCALLSNHEVLLLLNEIQENKQKLKDNKNLATIAYESIKYLEDSTSSGLNSYSIQQFLLAIKDKFRLTKAEKLQILNQRPNSLVELQLLIEENEERFSEQAMDQLLICINQTLNCDSNEAKQTINDNEDSNSDEISN
jgi:hypothetical protein